VWGSEFTTKAATLQGDSYEFVPSFVDVGLDPVVARAHVLVHEVLGRGAKYVGDFGVPALLGALPLDERRSPIATSVKTQLFQRRGLQKLVTQSPDRTNFVLVQQKIPLNPSCSAQFL
jgi:hypothetical protein